MSVGALCSDLPGSKEQCGTNIIFLDKWISGFIWDHRWANEYHNILGMIKRSWMNIRINMIKKKSTNIFVNENICPKYANIFKYLIVCPRFFRTILAIFIFCVILGPYQTILDHFKKQWKLKYICYHRYWMNE